jgi:hypothetical protein
VTHAEAGTAQLAFPVQARFLQARRNHNTAYGTLLPADMPITKKIRQTTRNRKNKNLAIPAAAAAIPVNPKSAATSAITRKIRAQRSMLHLLQNNRFGESLRAFRILRDRRKLMRLKKLSCAL